MATTFLEIVKRIETKRKDIENLSTILEQEQQELSLLENQNFQVRLSDLVASLSTHSGINVLDMDISLNTNIWVENEEEATEIYDNNQPSTRLEIIIKSKEQYGKNAKPFSFFIYQPLDFEQLQSDGKTLREHCSVVDVKKANEYCDETKVIAVTESIGSIFCNFNIIEIANNSFLATGTPKEMLQESIIECYNKNNEQIFEKE